MRAKLQNISRWSKLDDGKYINLPGRQRTVRLEVNVDVVTRFDVRDSDGIPRLLRVVEPSECPAELVFSVWGDCEVIPTTVGEVWWYTYDGQTTSFPVTTESFTKLEQRMEMTPEMEITILRANIRLEQRRREKAELMLVKQQREEAAAANADPETGEVADGEEPDGDPEGASERAETSGNSAQAKS